MAVTALTLSAERWREEVILAGSIDNVAGAAIVEGFTLPPSLGEVAILSVMASVINVATVPGAATAARGVRSVILSADAATLVDVVGTAEWMATGGSLAAFDRFDCFIDPDALVLFKQGEQLLIVSPEMDVNAAPTADLRVTVKAVRVPVPEPVQRGPIQLVR